MTEFDEIFSINDDWSSLEFGETGIDWSAKSAQNNVMKRKEISTSFVIDGEEAEMLDDLDFLLDM